MVVPNVCAGNVLKNIRSPERRGSTGKVPGGYGSNLKKINVEGPCDSGPGLILGVFAS